MAQQLMFDRIGGMYRGQATNGSIVTVTEDAMELALKKAGKTIYDSDWWVETILRVLEGWGIYCKRWVDDATNSLRLEFSTKPPDKPTGQQASTSTNPLTSGPLSSRLTSGKLPPKDDNR